MIEYRGDGKSQPWTKEALEAVTRNAHYVETCPDCKRVFNMTDAEERDEWTYGHVCYPDKEDSR